MFRCTVTVIPSCFLFPYFLDLPTLIKTSWVSAKEATRSLVKPALADQTRDVWFIILQLHCSNHNHAPSFEVPFTVPLRYRRFDLIEQHSRLVIYGVSSGCETNDIFVPDN